MPKPAALPFPILLCNTTAREQVEIALLTAENETIVRRDERAQALPQLIGELLDKTNTPLGEIKAIAVCSRAGSLTGTRIGVTVANTLGWLNKLPIIELDATTIQDACQELRRGKATLKPVAKVKNEIVY